MDLLAIVLFLSAAFIQVVVCSQRPTCITDCDGLPDGDYQSCRGCHIYASCVSGILYDYRPCNPLGLQWDDNTKRCETVSTTCGTQPDLIFTRALGCERTPRLSYIPDMELTCPEGEALSIQSAHFGRQVAGEVACPSPDARLNDDVTDCEQPLALRRVTSHCAGRNSCTLQPTTEFFDEPCEGVYKMLDVKYLCS